jgi:ubiquinone biosynthesis accessory factor UbiK
MLNPDIFDDIVKRLSAIIPPSLQHLRSDLEQNFRSILQSSFSKLDLVTREEFDTQVHVLARTRAKLEQLERQIATLEKSQD